MRGYVVCATPRSGSNYLCQLLAGTGVLGTPREYFNAVGRRKYDDPAYPEDPREQLSQVLTTGATPNGVWGVKLHPFQLGPLLDEVDPFVDLPHAAAVWIRRRDRLGQAVSWVRAQQTGQHRAGDRRQAEATYRADLVDTALAFLAQQDAAWAEHLGGRDVRVVEIAYEDLHRAPQRQVDQVAELMGVPGPVPVDLRAVSVRVQRDDLTQEWRERYLAERG